MTHAAESPEVTLEEAAAKVFGGEPSEAKSADEKAEAPPSAKVGSPADSATEGAEDEAKPQADDKVSKRIAIAKRIEIRAAQERERIQAERAELAKEKAELAELAKKVDAIKGAKLTPSKLLELAELPPKEFLELLATEHEPAAVAKRVAAEGMSEVEKVRAELAALRKELEDKKRATEQSKQLEEMKANEADVESAFAECLTAAPERFPNLIEFTPNEVLDMACACLNEVIGNDPDGRPITRGQHYIKTYGDEPSYEVVADFLEEHMAKPIVQRKAAWRERIGQRAKPSEGAPTGLVKAPRTDGRGQGPRTLTSRATSERASGRKTGELSQEEKDEESLRILNAAFR